MIDLIAMQSFTHKVLILPFANMNYYIQHFVIILCFVSFGRVRTLQRLLSLGNFWLLDILVTVNIPVGTFPMPLLLPSHF